MQVRLHVFDSMCLVDEKHLPSERLKEGGVLQDVFVGGEKKIEFGLFDRCLKFGSFVFRAGEDFHS